MTIFKNTFISGFILVFAFAGPSYAFAQELESQQYVVVSEKETQKEREIKKAVVEGSKNNGDTKEIEEVSVELEVKSVDQNTLTTQNNITIVADMIMCDAENLLPNWGNGSSTITNTTAQDFVTNTEGCVFEEGRLFQWGDDSMVYAGDEVLGEVAGWNTTSATDIDGRTQFTVNLDTLSAPERIEMRQVLEEGDIVFSNQGAGGNSNDVSAEFYCHTDVLNYDNWDWINNLAVDQTYYCVGFNVIPEEEIPPVVCEAGNMIINGSFENPILEGNWGTFNTEETGWNITWTSVHEGQPEEALLEFQKHLVVAQDGNQYVELDSDWAAPSGEPAGVSISQTLSTVVGNEYQVEFYVHARPNTNPEDNTLQFSVIDGGGVIQTASIQAVDQWDNYMYTFVAESSETTIQFSYTGVENSLGIFLDNVSVECNGEPVIMDPVVCTLENSPTLSFENDIIIVTSPNAGGILEFLALYKAFGIDPEGGSVSVVPDINSVFPIIGFGEFLMNVIATDSDGCATEKTITIIYGEEDNSSNTNDPVVDEPINTSSGSGSSGSRPSNNGGQILGEVLGASTSASCPQFNDFYRKGDKGTEIFLIQTFLNEQINAGLTVDGMFGSSTEKAVKSFQQKYWKEIIEPWTPPFSSNTTGRWYKTTKAWANELLDCRELPQILEDTGEFYSTADFVA